MISSRISTIKVYSPLLQLTQYIHISPSVLTTYHESGRRFGYEKFDPDRKLSIKEKINMYKEGVHDIKKGVEMWKDEVKDKWSMDLELNLIPSEYNIQMYYFNINYFNYNIIVRKIGYLEGYKLNLVIFRLKWLS